VRAPGNLNGWKGIDVINLNDQNSFKHPYCQGVFFDHWTEIKETGFHIRDKCQQVEILTGK
jgi:hypothetical protein